MKTNELRVGNIITSKSTSVHWVVMPSDIERIFENETHYLPIPLTEEWFLKCKSNSIFNNGFEYKKTSTGRFEIYVGMSLITVIEFVHELQNLNFALLGEEFVFEN